MKEINLSVEINASREAVWDTIVDDAKYREWTAAFNEGSFFEGGWQKGDSIRFLGINENGEKEGMISEIAESIYPEYISIRHLGFIHNGIEDTTSEHVKSWAPSYENYKLESLGNQKTLFKVNMEANDEFYAMFMDMWPKALDLLKKVTETVTIH